jgi:hypothetical protein
MVVIKAFILSILISMVASAMLSAETDSLQKTDYPQIVLQTDISGLAGFVFWPNALYRTELEGSYWFNKLAGIGLTFGRGGRSANVAHTNLYDYHTRGFYAGTGFKLRNFQTYERLYIYGGINYFYTTFETSGTFKIKHNFWDDYEDPVRLDNQNYHGIMITMGLQYWVTEFWNISFDIGVTTPLSYQNLDYPDPYSEIHHSYIPGAGVLLPNYRALKTSLRIGYKLDDLFSK